MRMKTTSRNLAGVCLAALLGACAPGPSESPAKTTVTSAVQPITGKARLSVAIKTDQPGIAVMSPSNSDDVKGLDVDVASYVAKGLSGPDVRVTWVPVTSKSREKMITDGDVDLVVASYAITDSRLEQVDFAGPYMIGHEDMVVRNSDGYSIEGVKDLKGRVVCTIENSTPKTRLENLNKQGLQPSIRILTVSTWRVCIDKMVVRENEVDAVLTDDIVLAGYVGLPEFANRIHLVGKPFDDIPNFYGIGISKGHTRDCQKINEVLRTMIADGTWESVIRKNIKVRPDLALASRPVPGETVKTCRAAQ